MRTALVTHDACLAHDPGPGHPECPARLRAVLAALDDLPDLERLAAPLADAAALGRVHGADYIAAILRVRPAAGQLAQLDGDTLMSAGSAEAALRAAGGAIAGVDFIMGGPDRAAFVAVRPPGHHAEAALPFGFCLFNNVAVAALHARDKWGLRRIAVVDFDVHHGNGTQAMFWDDADLFYASSHQGGIFPGSGLTEEQGAAGNVVNVPLPAGTDGVGFRRAWEREILPALRAFAPELLIVSAGFDAHLADPLASLRVSEADFAWLTKAFCDVAPGRLVSVLEGGYDLAALGASAKAHVEVLMGYEGKGKEDVLF
jgi:acetoin utilization deacetylase AcuC-like enzyme